MASILIGVAGAAVLGRYALVAANAVKNAPKTAPKVIPKVKPFYEGGFEAKMSRREAALILGIRESSTAKQIKDAHRRGMLLNHPDSGGSNFIASKVNEAKSLLLRKDDPSEDMD
eukprot:GCRY01001999.1.p1 GENE.GCRY01001999.1~~GCRY01001999.1.p1  ORF type:complete len:115 (+),score=2.52 GCRY01001999.1:142-486(+)